MNGEVAPLDLDAIEKLVNAATPGPWEESGVYAVIRFYEKNCWYMPDANYPFDTDYSHTGDAAFIAASRTIVPQLVAEVRRLRGDR